MKFWQDLRERRLAQFLLTYCAGGWLVLQVVDQFGQNSVLPVFTYRVVLTFFLCAFPGALIVSWFHGAKGRQRVPTIEKWLLAGVAALALTASLFVARANLTAEPHATGLDALAEDHDPRRVAVLYFDTRGGGEDGEFLAAGLTEALIDELSTVDVLHVVSKNGSMLFRGSDARSDSIGRSLGVGTLVDGLVAVAGDRVRVTVSMVEASSGKQLESTEIDRARADLFDLQDELARQVALFLRARIGEEIGDIEARTGTKVVEAWEMFRRAQEAVRSSEALTAAGDLSAASRELSRADTLLLKAGDLDPDWVDVMTERGWLAYKQALLGTERSVWERWTPIGLDQAERALAVAPNDADALELRATLLYWSYLNNLADDRDATLRQAEEGFRAAIAANPNQASSLTALAHLLIRRGEFSEAKLKAEQSYEADPFLREVDRTLWRLFSTSWELSDYIEATRWCDEGARRFPEQFRFSECRLMMFVFPEHKADLGSAWADYARFLELSPPPIHAYNEKKGLMYMAMAAVRMSLPDSADALLKRGRAGTDLDGRRELAQLEAVVRTAMGDYDTAAGRLSLYFTANPGTREEYAAAARNGQLVWYLQDLVAQPRFRELVDLR